jgi:predicted DNA-binding transcriptional regulator AlpA
MAHSTGYTPDLEPNRLYNGREVAAMFGVHISTLYAWMNSGLFPKPLRVGPRTVRWSGESIIAYVRDHIIGTSAA